MGTKRGTSRQKASALAPKYCEIPCCGYRTITQRHRIKPGRSGGKYAIGNVIALCPNHHAEADKTLEGRFGPGDRGYLPPELLEHLVLARIRRNASEEHEANHSRARSPEEEGIDSATESLGSDPDSEIDAADGLESGGLA